MAEDKINGKIGFDEKFSREGIVSKEETVFRIDKDGNAIPEKSTLLLYDRNLDKELIDETILLMNTLKRQKAINKIIIETINKQEQERKILQSKINEEKDEKLKNKLRAELMIKQNTENSEDIKSRINAEIVIESINESREIIRKLKQEITNQTKTIFVEIAPCTTSEAFMAFEKGKTIGGEETDDWVADLISRKTSNPKYSFEEAKTLKPDYKIAMKEAIMEVSGYKTKSYRDIMMELKIQEEKPLTTKKE